MIYLRLRRVEIFCRLGIGIHYPAAESDNLARCVVHREYDAPAKTVYQAIASLTLYAKTRLDQKFLFISFRQRFIGQRRPLVGRIAQLKFPYDIISETALAEIGQAESSPVGMFMKRAHEEVFCKLIDHEQAFPFVSGKHLLGRKFFLFYFNPVSSGKLPQSVIIGDMLIFHDEMHGIAAFAAAETFEHAFGGRHHKRWCLLIMERAQPYVVGAAFVQRHLFGDDIINVGHIQYLSYGSLVYHPYGISNHLQR